MNISKARKNLLENLHLLPRPVQDDVKFLLEQFDTTVRELESLKTNENFFFNIENLPHEIWRDVVGYEGIYQVSNMGRVRSLHWLGGRLIKPGSNKKGYLNVMLSKNCISKHFKVHILVARAFLPNPENKPIVHHKDGNRKNNRLDNLAWATPVENQQYSIQMGTKKYWGGSKNHNSKLTDEDVRYIRTHYTPYDKVFGVVALAKKFNVNQGTIRNIVKSRSYLDVV